MRGSTSTRGERPAAGAGAGDCVAAGAAGAGIGADTGAGAGTSAGVGAGAGAGTGTGAAGAGAGLVGAEREHAADGAVGSVATTGVTAGCSSRTAVSAGQVRWWTVADSRSSSTRVEAQRRWRQRRGAGWCIGGGAGRGSDAVTGTLGSVAISSAMLVSALTWRSPKERLEEGARNVERGGRGGARRDRAWRKLHMRGQNSRYFWNLYTVFSGLKR